MKRLAASIGLVLSLIFSAGCQYARPLVVWESVATVEIASPTGTQHVVLQNTRDPHLGEIMYTGLSSGLDSEAVVYIDGGRMNSHGHGYGSRVTIPSGGSATVWLEALGANAHTYQADFFLIEDNGMRTYYGCSKGTFGADPNYRNSPVMGHWWRYTISPSMGSC